MANPQPDPDDLWPDCDEQPPGVSIRPLRHGDLQALLAHLHHHEQDDEDEGLTCGAPAGQLGDLCVLPGSSSAAHATARSRSQRRPTGPSEGTGAQRRPLPPTKGWRSLAWEERRSPHMAATSPIGHAGDDEGSRVRTPSLTLVLGSSGFRRHDG
jgi:hypothetical protein